MPQKGAKGQKKTGKNKSKKESKKAERNCPGKTRKPSGQQPHQFLCCSLMMMTPKVKKLLGCGSIIGLILIGITIYGIYSIYSFYSNLGEDTGQNIPAELQEAKIYKGAELLNKKEFYKIVSLGFAEIIQKSLEIPDEKARQRFVAAESAKKVYGLDDLRVCGDQIIAVGNFGGYIFDKNGDLTHEINFEPNENTIKIGWYEQKNYQVRLENLKIVSLDNQKHCGFLSYDIMNGAAVYNLAGEKIWSYGEEKVADLGKILNEKKEDFDKKSYVLEAAVGDLDNDGVAEFIVAVKNDGIHVFNQDKQEKWFRPDEFPSAKLLVTDVNNDGKNDLLEISGSSSQISDVNGKIVGKLTENKDINLTEDFAVFGENAKNVLEFLNINDNKLRLFDLNNKSILESDAPLSKIAKEAKKADIPGHPEISFDDDAETVAYPKMARVRFRKDKPKYFAVVAEFISLPRSLFYLYDEKGTLVYYEVLPENAKTLAVIPTANENEEIIIGGKNTIWKYALN